MTVVSGVRAAAACAAALAVVLAVARAQAPNNTLLAGGSFSRFGNVHAYAAAAWDGLEWRQFGVGGGLAGSDGGTVNAITRYNGYLVFAGSFTVAQKQGNSVGVQVNNIAQVDEANGGYSSWTPLGSGLSDAGVSALAVAFGDLYACGYFTTAGETKVPGVAVWDTVRWSSVSSPSGGSCIDMITFNGVVFGLFTNAALGGTISAWDGYTWTTYYSDGGTQYGKLGTYRNDLVAYVADPFGDARVLRWTGSSWELLGVVAGSVRAFTEYDGALIAAGGFSSIGGVNANNIASWNGTEWAPLGTGISGYAAVSALAVYSGKLVAGGAFTVAGGVSARGFAIWDGVEWNPVGTGINFGSVFSLLVVPGLS